MECGDLYHIDNLAMSHCMNEAFGPMERGNHRQFHPLQCLQSMHDLFKRGSVTYQKIFEEVLRDLGLEPARMKTMRERQQHWLTNERNAAYQLVNIVPLKEWALRVRNTTHSSDHRRIAHEVALMLRMPSVILGLIFETDLGCYFETTMRWYSCAGEMSPTPGFRMKELHIFLYDFVQPWWTKANNDPRTTFKNTFDYIEDTWKDDPVEKTLRTKQILAGINAGYKEILKMSKAWFSVPLIYLILFDRRRAPGFMRAVNKVIFDANIITKEEFEIRNGRDPDIVATAEVTWLNKLREDENLAIAYFRFMGLHRECLFDDLRKLSKMQDIQKIPDSTSHQPMNKPLHCMQSEFPVLFEALSAVFELMPSNSRMLEQLHGILRGAIQPQDTIKFTDGQSRYTSNCYEDRKARKAVGNNRKGSSEFTGHKQMLSQHTGGLKHDRTKDQLILFGKQTMAKKRMYSEMDLNLLPPELRKRLKTSAIAKDGGKSMDTHIATKKKESYDDRAEKLAIVKLTDEDMTALALTTPLTNDASFIAQEEGIGKQERDLIRRFLLKGYWITRTTIVKEAPIVFPHFWEVEFADLSAKALKSLVRVYIDELDAKADALDEFTMFEQDVTGLDREERLALFVKIDPDTALYKEHQREIEDVDRYKIVFESAGVSLVDDEWINVIGCLDKDDVDSDDAGEDDVIDSVDELLESVN